MTDLWFEHAGTRLYALEQGQYARVISRCTVGDSTANLADVVRAFVIGAGGR